MGVHDFQVTPNGRGSSSSLTLTLTSLTSFLYRIPGVALGSDAIYIIGTGNSAASILKCPTTSIATADCTTYVQEGEEAFYTDSTYTTKVTSGSGLNLIIDDM